MEETCVKKKKKQLSEEDRRLRRDNERQRRRTRVNLGPAHRAWTNLRDKKGFKTDSELAFFLINIYLKTKAEKRVEPNLERSSSTETCESLQYEHPFMMSSPDEAEREAFVSPSVDSSESRKESGKRDAVCHRLKGQDERTTAERSEHRDSREDEDEEFSTSLSVGDGRYLVDLGSSSEFIVDEECILQLFKSCRECSRRCTVRKQVRGLKLVVTQACRFCKHRCRWTNLPDEDDEDDFQINGTDEVYVQTNAAMSPGSDTS